MKSRILIRERKQNKDRKFGSTKQYFPCRVIIDGENKYNALFTKSQLMIAIKRAITNPEDIPETSFIENLIDNFTD